MFAITRAFIKERQKFAKYVVEQKRVRAVGGGAVGDCYNTAYAYAERNPGKVQMVSG